MGAVPDPDDFNPTAPWRKLDEPPADKIQLIGAPVGIAQQRPLWVESGLCI